MNLSNFKIERFDIKLDTDFVGRNFIYFDEIDSTNTHLLKKIKDAEAGTVLFAEKQLKGRGRLEREWVGNKSQNLYFSILLPQKKKYFENINIVNLGTSLAVTTAIDSLYALRAEIKWPNDVMINRKKVSGILIESTSSGGTINKIVVGIGVNVNQPIFPGEFSVTPTSIKIETGEPIEREKLLAEILNNFEEMLLRIPSSNAQILKEWRNKCKMIGEKIEVVTLKKKLEGTFFDIDEKGFLLLRDRNGKLNQISIGDVTLLSN